MHEGAAPLTDLKTGNKILQSILKETGSQWSDDKTGMT